MQDTAKACTREARHTATDPSRSRAGDDEHIACPEKEGRTAMCFRRREHGQACGYGWSVNTVALGSPGLRSSTQL